MASATEERIIKLVQEFLLDEADKTAITPTMIGEKLDLLLTMSPKWRDGLDREKVTDELIRRFSLWIGQDATLQNNEGHKDWFSASRKQDWRYWKRYKALLERKLSIKAIDALDRSTDSVIKLLEDPNREGSWDRRGLVVGHVQSGKTSHYSGLICKAADAGYKIIIVLAGLHNNLRAQTQMRLDESFLGYRTSAIDGDNLLPIGVGEIDSDLGIRPNYATNRTEKGDFSTNIARNLGISPEQRPWLFVVKKNKTVLTRLLGWIRNHVATARDQQTGHHIVTHLPLLLIDDEADNASVDTKEMLLDENSRPDEEHEPTAINRLVRTILRSFSQSAYVGYTATPFANIFIHEQGQTREEGPDLFPEAFIINLAAPSNYVGPAKVFGYRNENGRTAGLPLVRPIADSEAWMPTGHRNGHQPLYEGHDVIPPSLAEAIDAFILSCAIRELRGQGSEHCSMLVHVTRFTSVQTAVHVQVEEHIRHYKQRLTRRIGHEPILATLKNLWDRDFSPTTECLAQDFPDLDRHRNIHWESIEKSLINVLADIQVRMINGTAKDALDYAENQETGLKVIAIGGDKLARGLTLEGLTVSYFLRASRMYDTLMQMGRWFGYRPGYIDLCRLYTTADLVEWFEHIADASEELREEFDFMAESGATPRDYGLKVQSHPVLMVTSRLKMRTARDLDLSFSGHLLETVTFHQDAETLRKNLDATDKLLSLLGRPESDPRQFRGGSEYVWEGSYLWRDVSPETIINFLEGYRTHPEAHKVNSALLTEFIRSLGSENELVNWTIALIGASRGEGEVHRFHEGLAIKMLKRSAHGQHSDRYSIGRLMSPRDEAIDLDDEAWLAALADTRKSYHADPGRDTAAVEPDTPNGPAIRRIRPKERGVLFLYTIDPALAGNEAGLPEITPPIIGFAISFPASNSGARVRYKVNNILWGQEYGGTE
ncbi:MAG: Z1 domain-containing protein [Alphaproteobacteria bacterium]